MIKKRLCGLVLTLTLVLGSSISAFCTDITTNGGTGTSTVTYTAATTAYTVSIPAVIAVDETETSFTITSSKMNLRPDEEIHVNITSGVDASSICILSRQNVPSGKAVATLKTTVTVGASKTKVTSAVPVAQFKDSATATTNLIGSVYCSGLNKTADTEAGDYVGTVVFKVTKGTV